MTEQLPLVQIDAAPPRLTRRQQAALDYIAAHHGVTADEIGAHLHSLRTRRPHPADERCDWCARDGRQVVTSKALKPLISYRRHPGGHLYVTRDSGPRQAATGGYDPATAPIPF